jgi:hypothetical protein
MALNEISTLATKELRQKAKLDLASLKRQGYTLNADGTVADDLTLTTTPGAMNYNADGNTGYFFRTYGPLHPGEGYDRIQPGWTVADRPTWVVVSVVPDANDNNESCVITITGGEFVQNTYYAFTGNVATVGTADADAPFYRVRGTYDLTQLPTQYNNDDIVNNPNVGGLVVGRPWIAGNPAPVTQDLILFFDSERTDCYPGTGTTIYNLVDNTPSTLGGNYTFSNGVLRLNNNTGNMGTNNARINCQTVSNFRTISLWYRQVSDSGGDTRYILDAREGVPSGYIYTGDPYGPAWAGSTMYEDGGVGVQVNYTEQIGTWRNLTLVNTAPMTDDINLFSRYSNDEGLDVEFGACMIYSRAITYEENLQNFNQFKTRYGL